MPEAPAYELGRDPAVRSGIEPAPRFQPTGVGQPGAAVDQGAGDADGAEKAGRMARETVESNFGTEVGGTGNRPVAETATEGDFEVAPIRGRRRPGRWRSLPGHER